ncbi:hypothetical protein G7Y89_g13123 [Cudoniella acicularis]|uniref:DUF3835 domain-containing protein n=1 Tax=Cudoniella acicularis TaxID=354080 RepID=A0A8H4VZ04_9HELO|nr:hypothetical protein G7Y89_g13123 [Cudoniella acicularis]
MAQTIKDSFLDLERHRQLLEDNIEKLRKSLRHWQTWEAEYEGLKEEILAAEPAPNYDQLQEIGRQYEGQLVNQKEVSDILGTSTPRTAAQVVNILDRRIDYVEQNVLTVKKQIEAAKNKLAAATIISTPEVRNEEGLPLTEIVEELDEEGNVISSHTSTPGSAKPQLLEVLQKAGMENISASTPPLDHSKRLEASVQSSPEAPRASKKGVKFAPDTKPGPEPQRSQTAKRVEEIMNLAKQQERAPSEPPIIPTNESPEDAALRREMLQYGVAEVGAVVAEIDLEEGSDWSDEDYDEDETSSLDDEDDFGRSTGRLVDDELRQQMIELEKRLGARVMENIGKKASDYDIVQEGIGRVAIMEGQQDDTQGARGAQGVPEASTGSNGHDQTAPGTTKKSVRFSEDLHISPTPKATTQTVISSTKTASIGNIVERNTPVAAAFPTPQKKASRFKLDRGGSPISGRNTRSTLETKSTDILALHPARPSTPKAFSGPIQYQPAEERTRAVPTGPEGKPMSATIVERDVPSSAVVKEPDELDPQLLHQEVVTEYHKARNRMIQRQGGFLQEEESEIMPLTEEEGGPKKMSRFKAARLAKS